MSADLNLKCPGNGPVTGGVPEMHACPVCGKEVETPKDEKKSRCLSCKTCFYLQSPVKEKNQAGIKALLSDLVELACKSGAGDAVVVPVRKIVIEEALADMCKTPECENYGLSSSCPPHVPGPQGFRKYIEHMEHAVFFKIDVSTEILMSEERRHVFRLLHEIAVGLEARAREYGCPDSKAFAGGSCKKIFCHDHADCKVVSQKGKCRNPDLARPSMSGFGINVASLMKTAKWKMDRITKDTDTDAVPMGNVCGLVLVC